MPIKGRTKALLERVGHAGTRTRQALSWGRSLPSPAWTLVTPYCKRTRPGRGTNTKAAGFPPLSRRSPAASLLPPSRSPSRSTHLGWGTRRHSLVGPRDPPVSERRQLSSPKLLLKTYLYAKFMLMILYLCLLTSHLVKSLVELWYRNSRCL
jgi:hypothetical protein